MRLNTLSGPLGGIVKILYTYLLLHLFFGHISARPFQTAALETRQTDNVNLIEARTLEKRARCVKTNGRWNCDGDVPGVDETNERMNEWGVVGTVPSVFYTGYPLNLNTARQWAKCFWSDEPAEPSKDQYKFAIWERLVDREFASTQSLKIASARPRNVDPDDNAFYKDMFLKHLAQSFAETSSGDVYLVVKDSVTPDNRSWDTDTAWGGWEFPALTRNNNVDRILRKDPASNTDPQVIWQRGDGAQGTPKGRRNPTKQVPLEDLDDETPP